MTFDLKYTQEIDISVNSIIHTHLHVRDTQFRTLQEGREGRGEGRGGEGRGIEGREGEGREGGREGR